MFKETLRQIMEDRGLTRQELADMSGISKTSLYWYLTGKHMPNVHNLKLLCEALRVDIRELIGED